MSEAELVEFCKNLQRENEKLKQERDKYKLFYEHYKNDCETLVKIIRKTIKLANDFFDNSNGLKDTLSELGYEVYSICDE